MTPTPAASSSFPSARARAGALGLVVNPVAGVGGPVGLKGSDGAEIQDLARRRGAVEGAQERATRALRVIASTEPATVVLTVDGPMGADAVRAAGLVADLRWTVPDRPTIAADTTRAIAALERAGASLILFVGGDGTARDVCAGIAHGTPVLGVPSGVKMYSGCFAVSPAAAGAVAAAWRHGPLATEEREVLDVDEDQVRNGRVDPRMYGWVCVPVVAGRTQSRKTASPASGREATRAAARGALREMRPGVTYLLGPGSTTAEIARLLGVPFTPLGVDVVRDARLVLADAGDGAILDAVERGPSRAIVTVIGGQGFLLGRGNQQISARVLRAIGPDPLLVVATQEKILELLGRPLLVDTGDREVDGRLAGHVRIITGPGTWIPYAVSAPELEIEGASR